MPMPSQSHIDVPYGDHKRQILDAWIPDITGPLPWLAFFHGGGFIGGDKSRLPDNFREACLDAGIAVLSANYRFVDDTAIYDIVDDVSTVLDFALEQDWPLDPERLALAGSSAGSGMALCAGLGPEAERVKAIISYNGQFSYDFTLWKEALGALPEHHPSRAPALYHVEDHDALEADALAPMRQKLDMLGQIFFTRHDKALPNHR